MNAVIDAWREQVMAHERDASALRGGDEHGHHGHGHGHGHAHGHGGHGGFAYSNRSVGPVPNRRSCAQQPLRRLVGPDTTVLDVGGGAGKFALPLATRAKHVTVVEPSADSVEMLRSRAAEIGLTNLTVIQSPWDEADAPSADVALCSLVLHHVPDAAPFVSKLQEHATDRVVVVEMMETPGALEIPFYERVHGSAPTPLPGLPDVLRLLWAMDIHPDVAMLTAETAVLDTTATPPWSSSADASASRRAQRRTTGFAPPRTSSWRTRRRATRSRACRRDGRRWSPGPRRATARSDAAQRRRHGHRAGGRAAPNAAFAYGRAQAASSPWRQDARRARGRRHRAPRVRRDRRHQRRRAMAFLGLPTVGDAEPGRGPLMGLYSGLLACPTPFALVVACDAPFLSPALLEALIAHRRPDAMTLPATERGPQPMPGLYPTTIALGASHRCWREAARQCATSSAAGTNGVAVGGGRAGAGSGGALVQRPRHAG